MPVSSSPAAACPSRPDPTGKLVDSLVTSMVFLLVLTVGQKLIGFARSIIVCRLLPPEELGTWSMLQTLVMVVSPMVLLSIPACFGRYFANYRQRGQLANFISQAAIICGVSLSLGVVGLWIYQVPIAGLSLGDSQRSPLVVYASLALIPFAIFSFLSEMLLALRYGRVASRANFLSTITLTVCSLSFLFLFPPTAVAMLTAFALSFALPLLLCHRTFKQVLGELPANEAQLPWAVTWGRMFPIILLFWFTDLLTNLFYSVDKFMLVNLSRAPFETVMADIGGYEAIHVLTGILFMVTVWIGKTLLPYMAKEWEEGGTVEVSTQTNMSIKLVGFASLAAGLLLSMIATPLCHLLFNGKYDSSAYLVPYLVYFYLGCGTTVLLMNYYWCAGIATWSMLPLIMGSIANGVVNYLLIPDFGVAGAAIGTTCGMACQIISLWAIAVGRGLSIDLGLIGFFLASSLLVIDRTGILGWCSLLVVILGFSGVFSLEERRRLKMVLTRFTSRQSHS
jgi:O-antigen/teichoic acid export membrane protein